MKLSSSIFILDSGSSIPFDGSTITVWVDGLQVGCTLDIVNEVFSWQPGPGVKGRFTLVFDFSEAGSTRRETMNIIIRPGF